MTPVNRVLEKLHDATPSGKGWTACCPAHEDHSPSLSLSEGEDGRALLKCHRGCKFDAICAAMNLRPIDLMPTADMLPTSAVDKPKRKVGIKGEIVATYDYRDEQGELVYQVVRYEPKSFRQRRPKPGGGWEWSIKGIRTLPYRLPELLAEPELAVIVAEGEKDCDNLAAIGLLATCNSGGAGKWTAEHAEFLRDRKVVVLADNDDAGRDHAQKVAESLQGIAAAVYVVELPGLPEKGDASDWIAAGGKKDALAELINAIPIWQPAMPEVIAAETPWPEIDSLDDRNLPDFPTAVLPEVLRRWVEAESHATQTPADLAALLALAVCASCIARRVVVEARTGWREPTNLFVSVLLPPGNRKSAVFADATKPLREVEAEMIDGAKPLVAQMQSIRRQKEARLRQCEKLVAERSDAEAREEAAPLSTELSDEPEPVLPRLLVDDATGEKLAMILKDQGGRIASLSPEGGVFDLMAGMYSKSGMPQFGVYLMGHSGDDLTSDRVSRNTVHVERPALTCGYAMQPSVIEGLADNVAFRGRGLLARFLYAMPKSWIGQREIAPQPVAPDIKDGYSRLIRTLAKFKGEFIVQLHGDAADVFIDWEREAEAMLAEGGEMEILQDWGSKLAGAALRIAGILHCVKHGPSGRIDVETISAAIGIAEYLIPHAESVLEMMKATDDSTKDDAKYILRWIERHWREEFTKRDAQQHGKRRFPQATDIDPPLGELVNRGYIRLLKATATTPGRPPSPHFQVNPAVFAKRTQNRRSCDFKNEASDLQAGDFENNENVID